MKKINTFIIEKLKLNKQSKTVKVPTKTDIEDFEDQIRDLFRREIPDKIIGKDYDVEMTLNPQSRTDCFFLEVYYVWNLFSENAELDFADIIYRILERHQDDLDIKIDTSYTVGASNHKGKQLGRYTDHAIEITFKAK